MKTLFSVCLCFFSLVPQSQTRIDSTKTVKVLSFNILHGKTMKGDFDLDIIAKVIVDANPDFVALQEVDFKTNRSKKYDLVTELG
jgi:endonuclease/exonuclease/phosphatase family metal-dependent hydrolase